MNYTASLTVQGVDNVSGPLGKAEAATVKLEASVRRLVAAAQAAVPHLQQLSAAMTPAQLLGVQTQIVQLAQNFRYLQQAVAQTHATMSALTQNVGRVSFKNVTNNVTNMGSSASASRPHVDELSASVARFVRIWNTLIVTTQASRLFKTIAREAEQFIATIETSRLAIAASILTFQSYEDANGKTVTGTRQYELALAEAGKAQELLRVKVFETTATFEELTVGYQKVIASAGASKASTQDMVNLTAAISNLATAWGADFTTISNQFQTALLGISRTTGRVGGFLRAMGITPDVLRSWRDNGVVVQNLNEYLREFLRIGVDLNQTWPGILSNLKDAFENTLGFGFKSAMDQAKKTVQELTSLMVDIPTTRATGVFTFNPEGMERIKTLSDSVAEAFRTLTPLLPAIVNAFLALAKAIADAVVILGPFVRIAADLLNVLSPVAAKLGGVGLAILAVHVAMTKLLALQAAYVASNGLVAASAAKTATALGTLSTALGYVAIGIVGGQAVSAIGTWIIETSAASDVAKQYDADMRKLAATLSLNTHANVTTADAAAYVALGTNEAKQKVRELARSLADAFPGMDAFGEAVRRVGANIRSEVKAFDTLAKLADDISKRYTQASVQIASGFGANANRALPGLVNAYTEVIALLKSLGEDGDLRLPVASMVADLEKSFKQIAKTDLKSLTVDMKALQEALKSNDPAEQQAARARLTEVVMQRIKAATLEAGAVMRETNDRVKGSVDEVRARYEAVRDKIQELSKADTYDEFTKGVKSIEAALRKADAEATKLAAPERFKSMLAYLSSEIKTLFVQAKPDAMEHIALIDEPKTLAEIARVTDASEDAMSRIRSHIHTNRAEWIQAEADKTAYSINEDYKRVESNAATLALMTGDVIRYVETITRARMLADAAIADTQNEAAKRTRELLATQARVEKKEWATRKQEALNAGDTIAAAYADIGASVLTLTQSTSDFIASTWRSTIGGIEDVLYALETGGNIKDVFARIFDDILKSFNRMVSKMVERWLFGTDEMSNGSAGGGFGSGIGQWVASVFGGKKPLPMAKTYNADGSVSGGGANPQLAQDVGKFATMALGVLGSANSNASVRAITQIGSSVIAMGSQIAIKLGASATAVSAVAAYVAVVMAAFAVVMHQWAQRKEYTGYVVAGASGVAPTGRDSTLRMRNSFLSSLADAFKASGTAGFVDIVRDVNRILTDYINGLGVFIHAGKLEDFEKNVKFFFDEKIPRDMLYELFGSTRTSHGELPGIKNVNIYDPSSFSETAPLTKLLMGLGFGAKAIRALIADIASSEPDKFIEKIKKLVIAVTSIDDMMRKFGGDAGAAFAAIDAKNAAPSSATKAGVAGLLDAIGVAKLFQGDELLTRAKEITDAALAFWDQQLEAIKNLRNAAREFEKGVGDLLVAMSDAMIGKSAGWILDDKRNRLAQIVPSLGQRGGALLQNPNLTPEELLALGNEAMALIADIFSALNEKLQAARALMDALDVTIAKFSKHTDFSATSMQRFRNMSADFQNKVAEAQRLSGDEQIAKIAEVNDAANAMWQAQEDLLRTIYDNVQDLDRGVAAQIEDIRAGIGTSPLAQALFSEIQGFRTRIYAGETLTEAEQKRYSDVQRQYENETGRNNADRYRSEISDLQSRLRMAQSPEEVKLLTDRIQELIGKYLGTFAADDPRRREAEMAAIAALEEMQAEARAAYARMVDEIDATNAATESALKNSKTLLQQGIDRITQEIERLRQALMTLNAIVQTSLAGEIDRIVSELNKLVDPLKELRDRITSVNSSISGSSGSGSGNGSGGGSGGGGKFDPIADEQPADRSLATGLANVGTSAFTTAGKLDSLGFAIDNLIARMSGGGGASTDAIGAIRSNPHLLRARAA